MKIVYKIFTIFFLVATFFNLHSQNRLMPVADGFTTTGAPVLYTEPPAPTMSVSWILHDFGNVANGNYQNYTIKIKNTSTSGNLNISWALLTTPWDANPPSVTSIGPGQFKLIVIKFQPDCVNPQTWNKTWEIFNNSSNYNPSKIITLKGKNTCSGNQMTITPSTWDFGTVNSGSVSKDFTVMNTCSSCLSFHITTGSIMPPFTISPTGTFTLAPGYGQIFTVTFNPQTINNWTTIMHLMNDSQNFNPVLSIILKGKKTL